MTPPAILHIPHSSTIIPFKDGYKVNDDILSKEILKLTDWYTDDLFLSGEDITVRADFSRIFCDVERFTDDTLEPMAEKGMGVLYEKSDDGVVIRDITPSIRERIIGDFYRKHHDKLSRTVDDQLKTYGKALIIDCHSYPDQPLQRDLDQRTGRPDFNIGTDNFHTPEKLIKHSVDFFNRQGCSLGIDEPYTGSIVPIKHYGTDKRVSSIMLEINRKLYLKGDSNEKSPDYQKIKTIVKKFIMEMKLAFWS